jgi:folate-binding protein YgfZ
VVETFPLTVARRPRSFLRVAGADAATFLQALVSNDVEALAEGESCEALLLTPKARVIAPLVVLRRAAEDFLLLTEPELGERVRAQLVRFRLRSKVEIEPEEHESVVVLGQTEGGIPNRDYGVPAVEVLDETPRPAGREASEEELEVLRILARTPRFGREIDDRVLPAEAGLVERAVSFTKGCYPGQEPVVRLHHRGHANRGLRVLELEGEPPEYDTEVRHGERIVGRITSTARDADGKIAALAYIRVDVARDAELAVGDRVARQVP